jgi:hypothetical protein
MNKEAKMQKQTLRFVIRGALAIAMLLSLNRAISADKDWRPICHARLQKDKDMIDRDVARFGEHSHKVDRDVAKLDEDRQWCRDRHAEWDHSAFDVGIYIRR